MRLQFLLIILMLSVSACQNSEIVISEKTIENVASITVSKDVGSSSPNSKLTDFFSNDKEIGNRHKNKIEISQFKGADDNFVVIKFYSLDKSKEWKLKQNFKLPKYGDLPVDPQINDFNNDGFKDITFVSSIAARGANEVRSLLIYNKKKDEIVYIKNSSDYPNLLYNKELNCIDSWLVYGGNSTVFLRIDGNALKEFAYVENFGNEREVYLIDKNGKERLLRKDTISNEDSNNRYKNFNPLKPYR